ncbi:MAG: hypothetical protein KOO69_07970, partial [Victivallales bacterium]|nr:hypothetical protein [Victivallales bacterium]
MSQSLSQLYVHIVFHINCNDAVTIPEKLQPDLHAYIAAICKNNTSKLSFSSSEESGIVRTKSRLNLKK